MTSARKDGNQSPGEVLTDCLEASEESSLLLPGFNHSGGVPLVDHNAQQTESLRHCHFPAQSSGPAELRRRAMTLGVTGN
jgi:hypothetical protein